MTEEKKTESAQPDINALQAQLNELQSTLIKREEALAYQIREVEKLKNVKTDRDKMLNDKAATGDIDAINKIKAESQNQIAETEEKYKKELSQVQGQLKREMVTKQALLKASNMFVDSEDVKDFLTYKIEKTCDLVDGKIVVKDEKGEIRYSNQNKREQMGLDEYLKELADKNPALVKPSAISGTMQNGKMQTTAFTPNIDISKLVAMSKQDQIKAIQSIESQKDREALVNKIFLMNINK